MITGFGNNTVSALASDITATQTTFSVIPGAGDKFEQLLTTDNTNAGSPHGVYAKLTLTDSQGTVFEICHLTKVAGDSLTVIRGQEGTTAKGWSLNDVVANFATRGSEESFVQIEQLQGGDFTSATAGGTPNGLTISLPSTFFNNASSDWLLKTPLMIMPIAANTGAVTIQVTLAGNVVGTFPAYKGNKAQLEKGDILAGVPFICAMDNTKAYFTIINPVNIYGALLRANNLSDLNDGAKAKENLALDKVGNWVAVQQGGGTGMESNKVYVGWDGGKLIAQVDSTAMGELFYESNPPTASQTGALPTTGGNLTGDVTTSAEIRCTNQNNFRMVNGNYGIFWRQDGNTLYLMLTKAGDQYGGYNDFRPIHVDLSTGLTYINNARPYSANNCPFPVGFIMLMGVGANPNDAYPGTTWQDLTTTYGGRNLQFGYDGLGTGGNNSVTIGANNLPDHSHKSGWGAPGAAYANDLRTGTDNTGTYSRSYTIETFTDGANGANVQNTPIDVTNAYVHIMGWMRTS